NSIPNSATGKSCWRTIAKANRSIHRRDLCKWSSRMTKHALDGFGRLTASRFSRSAKCLQPPLTHHHIEQIGLSRRAPVTWRKRPERQYPVQILGRKTQALVQLNDARPS